MKTRWWVPAFVTALLALTCCAVFAQNDESRGNDKNRGQSDKKYRKFNEKQRQHATTYYNQNRNHEVFKQDNWNNDYENRLQPGYVLDEDMRRMSRPAPDDMIRGLGRPPRGYRYVVIGGHVVLIDDGYRVHDMIHFEVNVGH
jgi:Ni/Co efflux regulator RcnB